MDGLVSRPCAPDFQENEYSRPYDIPSMAPPESWSPIPPIMLHRPISEEHYSDPLRVRGQGHGSRR